MAVRHSHGRCQQERECPLIYREWQRCRTGRSWRWVLGIHVIFGEAKCREGIAGKRILGVGKVPPVQEPPGSCRRPRVAVLASFFDLMERRVSGVGSQCGKSTASCTHQPSAITQAAAGYLLLSPGRPSRMSVGLFRASSSATNKTGWQIICCCDYPAAYTGRSTLATFPLLFWERPTCIRGSSDMQRLLGLVRNERAHPQPPTSQRMIHDEQYYYYSVSSAPASCRPLVLPTPPPPTGVGPKHWI